MRDESEHVNPFAAPLASDSPLDALRPEDISDAEAIRKELLNREASIKGIGSLYLLGAFFLSLAVAGILLGIVNNNGGSTEEWVVFGVILVLTGIAWFIGFGLRRLQPTVRPWAIAVVAIYLFLSIIAINPISLLFNGYIMWLIATEKGKRVLSPEYQEIIAATPHIKYKTSIVVWILLGVLLLLFVGVLVGGVLAP